MIFYSIKKCREYQPEFGYVLAAKLCVGSFC